MSPDEKDVATKILKSEMTFRYRNQKSGKLALFLILCGIFLFLIISFILWMKL